MKISKFILACVLSGMVGNVLAEPVTITCKFDDIDVKKKPEIEFDDNTPNRITVNGKLLPYSYAGNQDVKGNVKLIEFNTATISWLEELEMGGYSSFFYKINRKTGRITYEHKSMNLHNIYRGTCTKMANNGF